jgi:hypothetical protein
MPGATIELEPFSFDRDGYRLVLSREIRQRYRRLLWGTALLSLSVLLVIGWYSTSSGSLELVRLWLAANRVAASGRRPRSEA